MANAAVFLRFVVERCGMDQRYLPPGADRMGELVGVADTPTKQSTPLKPEQFTALLDALAEAERWDLQLAVGLVGYLGLRPSELATLTVDDEGVAWVGAVKRNANTMTKAVPPRVVAPIEVEGRVVDPAHPENGEGAARSMKNAIRDAGLGADDMIYLPSDRFGPLFVLRGVQGLRFGVAGEIEYDEDGNHVKDKLLGERLVSIAVQWGNVHDVLLSMLEETW